MAQTLDSLKQEAAAIREEQRAFRQEPVYRKQLTALHEALAKQKEKVRIAELRAEAAERQMRDVSADRDAWKARALAAEVVLKSTGRAEP